MVPTIMIVSTDRNVATFLADGMQAQVGMRGAVVTSAADARTMSRSGTMDLAMAIIDTDLLDGEGHALCADLLQSRRSLPVMMVSRTYSEADVIRSLQAGAIDVFHRPHHRAELLARLRAHLRSQETLLETEMTVGPFTFRPGQRVLVDKRTRNRVFLTAKETRLLRRLHAANGRPVPKAELLSVAWEQSRASTHTLHTHIYRLRSKLDSGSAPGPALETTRGGYVLRA